MLSSPGKIEPIGSENQNNYMCTCPKPANSQVNSGVKRGRCSNRQTNEKRRVYRKSAFVSKRIYFASELYNTPIFYFQLNSSETIEHFRRNSKINSETQNTRSSNTKEILINLNIKGP